MRVALIQFDAHPEAVEYNLGKMETLIAKSAEMGAHWIFFHEGTVCDYTPKLKEYAEEVPAGISTSRMIQLAKRHDCVISFGLSETDNDRIYIAQVFVDSTGLLYRYRKTWLWRESEDSGYRNEWARYDPGTGPELFFFGRHQINLLHLC